MVLRLITKSHYPNHQPCIIQGVLLVIQSEKSRKEKLGLAFEKPLSLNSKNKTFKIKPILSDFAPQLKFQDVLLHSQVVKLDW